MLSWRLPGRQHFTPRYLIAAAFFIIVTSVFLFANSSPRFTSYNHHPSTTSSHSSAVIDNDAPINACFVVLVRNSELGGIASTIRQIEQRFNAKHKYPYVFLNDDDFTQEFIDTTAALTEAETQYGKLDQQMWGYPSFINQTFAAEQRDELARMGIPYASSESYRHMCRFQSGFFFRHPLLDAYDYYWRIEPDVDYHCDIDYDVFKFMRNNNKKYGFNIAFREFAATVPSLWQTVLNFQRSHPEVLEHLPAKEDSLWRFVTDNNGETYNMCHFWTNFEIASLDLWRSNDYLKLFNYLDRSGGFFYERWGDAPVHSIAASMMLRKDEFHFFNDIGYRHTAYTHCPTEPEFRDKCSCNPEDNFDYDPGLSCYSTFKEALKA
ncbi:nucleotide-diphospho-sugar transferase [Syncephalastrum racemosum]|uniref:Nucleotide-diphospho-sugar transferase n=1 Tax=Syncephalastrum racemosum TaxID=13706 RepID=A0A1X2H9V6_SYNRA|nr:nucleotide-diphospho-sugar transferase [Syncephalastrum racemosum]